MTIIHAEKRREIWFDYVCNLEGCIPKLDIRQKQAKRKEAQYVIIINLNIWFIALFET